MSENNEGGMDRKVNAGTGVARAGARANVASMPNAGLGPRVNVGARVNANSRTSAKVSAKKTAKSATKPEKENGDSLKMTWREVCRKQKSLMIAMVVLLVMSAILLIFALTTLRPQNTVVVVRYGDVYGDLVGVTGGYQRDSWLNMLTFPILALVFGLVHNVMVLRVYRKYGRDTAMLVVMMSILLVVGAGITLIRLTGEW